jgi:hypothetical protein
MGAEGWRRSCRQRKHAVCFELSPKAMEGESKRQKEKLGSAFLDTPSNCSLELEGQLAGFGHNPDES